MNERYFAEKQDGVNTIHAEDFNLAFGDIADDMATLEAEAAASDAHIKNASNPHSVTKAQIGLGNVDNTKDADKPVSTATQAALDLKANAADVYYKNVLYTKNETDAKLALKANSADIYTKPEVDEKISSVSIWGGAVSSWEGLPTNPKPGTYCYVSSDIANGAKYSGKASDFFVIDSLPLGGDGIYICGLKTGFILDTACVGTNSGLDAVCVYNAARSKVGEIWPYDTGGNYPLNFSIELLGLSSADDTVTFYLGYWDGTSFPAKIENFSAGSMIFWNGTEWCGVASSDTVGDIESALDGILSIQNALIGGGSE